MTFTTQAPTRAGVYLWDENKTGNIEDCCPFLILGSMGSLPDWGQWSERLIPVSEVEKAYKEGLADARFGPSSRDHWLNSHARKVVEGEV
jgi:hypothetical protein